MQTGIEFLKAQVDEAIALHSLMIQSMSSHDTEADDQRYQDLCERHLPKMREHQKALEEFARVLGPAQSAPRTSRSLIQLADAPQTDFQRLTTDLDLARRLEVVFKTFRDAGRELKIDRLARLGETAERHHDDYSAEAKRLLLHFFVERADGAGAMIRVSDESRADSRIR